MQAPANVSHGHPLLDRAHPGSHVLIAEDLGGDQVADLQGSSGRGGWTLQPLEGFVCTPEKALASKEKGGGRGRGKLKHALVGKAAPHRPYPQQKEDASSRHNHAAACHLACMEIAE